MWSCRAKAPSATHWPCTTSCRLLEALGYETAWFGDRVAVPSYAAALTPPNWFDALTCCLVGMGATTTLRFGTECVDRTASQSGGAGSSVATADQLSGGRLTLGLGVGYLRGELVAGGAPPYEERGPVTDEVLDVLRLALAADPDVRESFAGRSVALPRTSISVPGPSKIRSPSGWVGTGCGPSSVRPGSARMASALPRA